ncbi:MAG: hypothetical protein GY847_12700 [Proteobacteria bacterium]|nr:hypothetical protein [Pseudomonadota bacterium]
MRQSLSLLFLLALLHTSCAGLGQGRSDKLRDAIFYFNEGVRWGRLQDVLSRIDPDSEAHFLEMHKDFGTKIQLTAYEIVNTKINLEEGVAEVGLKLTWYRIDEMVLYETVIVQHWKENEREWYMEREEYRSGTPF